MKTRWGRAFWLSAGLLVLAVGLSVTVGAVPVPLPVLARLLWAGLSGRAVPANLPAYYHTIVFDLRLPHTVLMLLTGAALGSSGAAYQGVFRNPLADPYLLGIASGAGLGAVLILAIHRPAGWGGALALPVAAFVGAVLTVALVYALAQVEGRLPTTTLILAGVAIGSLASALTSFLMLESEGTLQRAITYLMGGAPLSGWQPVLAMLPYWLVGQAGLLLSGHALNVLQFGEEQAQHLGLNARRAKALILAAASLTTAVAVAFAGIIGFIGLVVPHVVRLLWGEDYRREVPLSLLGGATALLLADLLARTLLAPRVLPVGIVTALFGAPFFLWVLRRARPTAT